MTSEELVSAAHAARSAAYAPYSSFAVGAALLTDSGRLFTGCNIENISFGLTICAERAAICAAVSAGERRFTSIAIVSDSKTPVSPCGACRQVLSEFGSGLEVISATVGGEIFRTSLAELFPRPADGILGK